MIPKIFIKEGVQATEAAKEAVARVKNAVQTEVINTEKLLRSPASDLFEKKGYMETEAFWHDPQNFANYARGQYLTEGGKAFQDTRLCGEKIIGTTDNIERRFVRYQGGNPNEIINYEEKNLLTGDIRSIQLYNGKPHYTHNSNWYGGIYHNHKTGAPSYTRSFNGKTEEYKIFATDGKTVTSEIKDCFNGTFEVKEIAQDGSYTVKMFKNAKQRYIGKVEGDLESISHYDANSNLTKAITLHNGTKTPKEITVYENGFPNTQYFDKDGNLV